MKTEDEGLSRTTAVASCTALASLHVAILYAPTLLLRLPPPANFRIYMIRRFICASICSVVSIVFTAMILPLLVGIGVCSLSTTNENMLMLMTKSWDISYLLGVYGIRFDHLVSDAFVYGTVASCGHLYRQFHGWIFAAMSNIVAWRNYVMAPLMEELVFRACVVSLLLCGGFSTYTSMFLGPIFFSLAHLNHLIEIYIQEDCPLMKAFAIVGFQLCYTVLFGSFASFIFIRTGHLTAPIATHMLCNFMGLPVLYSRRKGLVTVAFLAGEVTFVWLLFPLTRPGLYNDQVSSCSCWHGYCS